MAYIYSRLDRDDACEARFLCAGDDRIYWRIGPVTDSDDAIWVEAMSSLGSVRRPNRSDDDVLTRIVDDAVADVLDRWGYDVDDFNSAVNAAFCYVERGMGIYEAAERASKGEPAIATRSERDRVHR